MKNKLSWGQLRLILAIGFIILLFVMAEMTGIRQEFSLENLKKVFDQNIFVAVLIFITLFSFGNLLFIPGWLFLAGAIFVLGHFQGYLLTFSAAVCSCCFSFLMVKMIGGDALREIPYKWAQKLLGKLDEYPIRAMALLRLGLQTNPALNYTLALTGLKFRHYFIGTILGLPIPILVYTLFIDQLIAQLK